MNSTLDTLRRLLLGLGLIAAAAAATGKDADDLLAQADAKIAKDPAWALGLRPMLLEIRGQPPQARAEAYAKVLAELQK